MINITINTTGFSKGHRALYFNYSCIYRPEVQGTNGKLLKTENPYLSSLVDHLQK